MWDVCGRFRRAAEKLVLDVFKLWNMLTPNAKLIIAAPVNNSRILSLYALHISFHKGVAFLVGITFAVKTRIRSEKEPGCPPVEVVVVGELSLL